MEVEVPLRGACGDVICAEVTAYVIVVLDEERVEGDGAVGVVEEGVQVGVWIGTLWCGGEVESLGIVGVHEGTELEAEGAEVVVSVFEVEVEAIYYGGAEGAESVAGGVDGAEGVPDELGVGFSSGFGGEAALVIGCAANGEEDCLAVGLLALVDLGGVGWAVPEVCAGEDAALVALVGEVDLRLAAGAGGDVDYEAHGDDIDVGVLAVGGDVHLFQAA